MIRELKKRRMKEIFNEDNGRNEERIKKEERYYSSAYQETIVSKTYTEPRRGEKRCAARCAYAADNNNNNNKLSKDAAARSFLSLSFSLSLSPMLLCTTIFPYADTSRRQRR